MSAGFRIELDDRLDEGWQLARFRRDLRAAKAKLPTSVAMRLSLDTTFIVNKDTRPDLRGCCYHNKRGGQWLQANGFPRRFAGSVHIYCLTTYCKDADCWGPGGCLVHELAHAFHDKCVHDGHWNPHIEKRFHLATPLYSRVRVKPNFLYDTHYACRNPAEFFAELSTAFLETDSSLYNKWEPHNRRQLQAFDPTTTDLLHRIWLDLDPSLVAGFPSPRLSDPAPLPNNNDDDDDVEAPLLNYTKIPPRLSCFRQRQPVRPCPPSWLRCRGGLSTLPLVSLPGGGVDRSLCSWLLSPWLLLRHAVLRFRVRPSPPTP